MKTLTDLRAIAEKARDATGKSEDQILKECNDWADSFNLETTLKLLHTVEKLKKALEGVFSFYPIDKSDPDSMWNYERVAVNALAELKATWGG